MKEPDMEAELERARLRGAYKGTKALKTWLRCEGADLAPRVHRSRYELYNGLALVIFSRRWKRFPE